MGRGAKEVQYSGRWALDHSTCVCVSYLSNQVVKPLVSPPLALLVVAFEQAHRPTSSKLKFKMIVSVSHAGRTRSSNVLLVLKSIPGTAQYCVIRTVLGTWYLVQYINTGY